MNNKKTNSPVIQLLFLETKMEKGHNPQLTVRSMDLPIRAKLLHCKEVLITAGYRVIKFPTAPITSAKLRWAQILADGHIHHQYMLNMFVYGYEPSLPKIQVERSFRVIPCVLQCWQKSMVLFFTTDVLHHNPSLSPTT